MVIGHEKPEFKSIMNNIIGVLFFGCIHDERPANFKECCLRCAAVEFHIPPAHQVAETLKTSTKWTFVKSLLEQFRKLPIGFPIRSFCELKETVYKPRSGRSMIPRSDVVCRLAFPRKMGNIDSN